MEEKKTKIPNFFRTVSSAGNLFSLFSSRIPIGVSLPIPRLKPRGFTLVEILIVIAVIGILSTLLIAAVKPKLFFGKSRDQQRRQNLVQISTALENYYQDNGSYPTTSGSWYSSESGNAVGDNGGSYIPGLAPSYIKTLPRDPNPVTSTTPGCGTNWKNAFLYRSDGTGYKIMAHCSIESTTFTSSDPFYDSTRPGYAWQICAGSGCNW